MSFFTLWLQRVSPFTCGQAATLIVILTLIRRPEAWALLKLVFGRIQELRFFGIRMTFFDPKTTKHAAEVRESSPSKKTQVVAAQANEPSVTHPEVDG